MITRPQALLSADPAYLRRICQNQTPVSLEKAKRSVQAGIAMGTRDGKGLTREAFRKSRQESGIQSGKPLAE